MSTPSRSRSSPEPEALSLYHQEFMLRSPQRPREAQDSTPSSPPVTNYVPILPKPPSPTSSPRRCRVSLCIDPNCNLRTHRQYARGRKSKRHSRLSIPGVGDVNGNWPGNATAEAVPRYWQFYRLSISQAGVDGLPTLPTDDLDGSPVRHLFHRFFSDEYDRIYRILIPPPFTKGAKQVAKEQKHNALARGASASIYCLHYAAFAQLQTSWKRDDARPDRNSVFLHSKVMNLLRAKLDDLVEEEIQDILTVVLTICMFEISSHRMKSLNVHRDATELLLKRCGGIQNIKRAALLLFLTLDRLLSMFTDLPPLYESAPNNFIRKPPIAPFMYGSWLEEPVSRLILGDGIHQYGHDICRAIELLEWENWSFKPSSTPIYEWPDVHYFYFLRDCIANDFVRLNVQTATQKTVARCFLLVAKIVDYHVLMDNYIPYLAHGIADKAQRLLCAVDCDINWQDYTAILIWMLFVFTSMANQWDGHVWALEYLRQQLELKHGNGVWPPDWRQRELDNLRTFVWSDTRFNDRFNQTCNELQYATAGTRMRIVRQLDQL